MISSVIFLFSLEAEFLHKPNYYKAQFWGLGKMNDSFLYVPKYTYGVINLNKFVPIPSLSKDFH